MSSAQLIAAGDIVVRTQGVCVRFSSHPAVDDVTLEVAAGEVVAIVGASGAGKSSLLRCIGGLLEPAAGHVELADRDLWAESSANRTRLRRRLIGYVTQGADLVPELRLNENVELPSRLIGNSRREASARAEHFLSLFDVAHLGRRFPDEVSGGERQRAALARALTHRPALVLADEPTGALDEQNRATVTNALLSAARSDGAAVIMITHDGRIAAAADRVLSMKDGRIRSRAQ